LGSEVRRTPRKTDGTDTSGVPLQPTVATMSPSDTAAPFLTPIVPRWTSVTENPSDVWIVITLPLVGTVPANDTVPAVGASTATPSSAPIVIPRCWPPVYGSEPRVKGRRTGPRTGHVHARTAGAAASTSTARAMTIRRMLPPCCQI
jgi:hypothetical protein